MRLSSDKVKTIKQFSKALRDWAREKIDTTNQSPEGSCYGSLIIGPLGRRDFGGKFIYKDVVDILCEFDPKVANEVKIEIEELSRRAREVDIGNQKPDFAQDYAADIAKELKGIARRRTTQPTPETTKQKAKSVHDLVFIGYSHKDNRWLDDLQTHLKSYVRNGSVKAWSDKQIAPGSKWFPEIKAALASTKVAVLLVTPDFLASDFIHEHELGPLLKEAENGKVSIFWIPVKACAYKETSLKDYQAAIEPDKPLAQMKAERDKAWVRICEEIKKAVSSSLS